MRSLQTPSLSELGGHGLDCKRYTRYCKPYTVHTFMRRKASCLADWASSECRITMLI